MERVDFMKDLGVVFDSELSFAFPVCHFLVLQIQLSQQNVIPRAILQIYVIQSSDKTVDRKDEKIS